LLKELLIKKGLNKIKALSLFVASKRRAALRHLPGQQTALVGHIPSELEVRADNNWLVGSDPDGEHYIGDTIEPRAASRGHDPIYIPRVRCQERYRGGAHFTRVSSGRA
jgi:hypothetical protein